MAWNEPGGDDRDPWSGKGREPGPPDLDEVVKKLQKKMGGWFGGKKNSGGIGGGSNEAPTPNGKGLLILLAIAAVVLLGFKSFYIVQPAERGVIQRFGAALPEVALPGPHLLIPFVDTVTIVNVDKVNKFGHRAQMLTKDENIVDITLTVQYRVQKADDFLFRDAEPIKTIYRVVESALREVAGKSTLDEIITQNRIAVAEMVKRNAQELLDSYRTGLVVVSINIQEANPPEEVKEAFDDATKAMADKERVQNQADAYANDIVPRARGAAARQIENAKAYSAKVVAEAEGETARFLALLEEYRRAPEVTRERLYLDTMQSILAQNHKVLLDVKEGNGTLTYLPLDKLMGTSGSNLAPKEQVLPGYDSLEKESQAKKAAEASERSRREALLARERAGRTR